MQQLLVFTIRDIRWQLEQYSVIRLNVEMGLLASIAAAHADMMEQRGEQAATQEVQGLLLAISNTVGARLAPGPAAAAAAVGRRRCRCMRPGLRGGRLIGCYASRGAHRRCVQHLQDDTCHQIQLHEVAALLGAFARLGYRALVVQAMLQQVAKAVGCALARMPEEAASQGSSSSSSSSQGSSSSGGGSRGVADPEGLVQLLDAYVQLGFHPGEVLLLSATVQLERQAQQLPRPQLERLVGVLEACQFHSATFSRAALAGQ